MTSICGIFDAITLPITFNVYTTIIGEAENSIGTKLIDFFEKLVVVYAQKDAGRAFAYSLLATPIVFLALAAAFREIRPGFWFIALLVPATIFQSVLVALLLRSGSGQAIEFFKTLGWLPSLWIFPIVLLLHVRSDILGNVPIRPFYRLGFWVELTCLLALWCWTFLLLSNFQD